MSRKDYELLARVFASVNPDNYTSTVEVRAALLHALALTLKAENRSFNIVKFMRAATPKGHTGFERLGRRIKLAIVDEVLPNE